MNAADFLTALVRTSIALTVACLAVAVLTRLFRVTSPTLHRAGWILALVVGWTFFRFSVAVPWYERNEYQSTSTEQASPDSFVELSPAAVSPQEAVAELPSTGFIKPAPDTMVSISPAATAPAQSASSAAETRGFLAGIDWASWALLAWAIGLMATPALWLVGYLRFVRRLPALGAAEAQWTDEWNQLLAERGVRPAIPLRVTVDLGPVLCRLPSGYELLVPERFWRELDAAGRAAILRHELAHYLRGDVWTSLAARLLALPHWFNPASWWAVRRFDEAAEWACDRAGIGDDPATAYAAALLRLGELAQPPAAFGRAARGRPLAARIRRLLGPSNAKDSIMKTSALVVVGLLLAALPLVRLELVAKQPSPAADSLYAQVVTPRNTTGTIELKDREKTGPTVSPYLNLLQSGGEPKEPAVQFKETDAQPEVAPPTNVAENSAAKKVATAAAKGFAASEAAYRAQTTTFETLCIWSERWVEAELEAATTPAQKRAALEANLKRFQKLHEEVAKLAAEEAQGGEATHVATTEFYLARAERRLADMTKSKTLGVSGLMRAKGATLANEASGTLTLDVPATNLLYEGKDFGYWRNALRNELSVERRTEALRALAAFASHGYGPAAMQATIDAMSDTSIWDFGSGPERTLRETALGIVKRIPPPTVLGVVTKALKTGNANQRLFAVAIVSQATARPLDSVPLLVEATRDEDQHVRMTARRFLAIVARHSPETIAALRAALHSEDVEEVVEALALREVAGEDPSLGGMMLRSTHRPIPELGPDLVALLGHPSEHVHNAASAALARFDSKTLEPLLDEKPASDDPAVRKVLEEILEKVRAAEAKQPAH